VRLTNLDSTFVTTGLPERVGAAPRARRPRRRDATGHPRNAVPAGTAERDLDIDRDDLTYDIL
jgi:hypothetical protein